MVGERQERKTQSMQYGKTSGIHQPVLGRKPLQTKGELFYIDRTVVRSREVCNKGKAWGGEAYFDKPNLIFPLTHRKRGSGCRREKRMSKKKKYIAVEDLKELPQQTRGKRRKISISRGRVYKLSSLAGLSRNIATGNRGVTRAYRS